MLFLEKYRHVKLIHQQLLVHFDPVINATVPRDFDCLESSLPGNLLIFMLLWGIADLHKRLEIGRCAANRII